MIMVVLECLAWVVVSLVGVGSLLWLVDETYVRLYLKYYRNLFKEHGYDLSVVLRIDSHGYERYIATLTMPDSTQHTTTEKEFEQLTRELRRWEKAYIPITYKEKKLA